MAYRITYTKRFEKHYKKMTPVEKKQIKSKVVILAENPLHPSLRTKRIQGMDELSEFFPFNFGFPSIKPLRAAI